MEIDTCFGLVSNCASRNNISNVFLLVDSHFPVPLTCLYVRIWYEQPNAQLSSQNVHFCRHKCTRGCNLDSDDDSHFRVAGIQMSGGVDELARWPCSSATGASHSRTWASD